jgi:hypothetical protein
MSRIEGPGLGVGAELGVGVRVVGVGEAVNVGVATEDDGSGEVGVVLTQPASRQATVSGIEARFLFMARTSIG